MCGRFLCRLTVDFLCDYHLHWIRNGFAFVDTIHECGTG